MNRDRVIVVGAGPVGLAAALTLAQAGIEVLVLERSNHLDERPRASTVHPATLQILDSLQAARPLIARGRRVEHLQWRNRRGTILAEMHLSALETLTRYPYRLHADQAALSKILLAQVARTGLVQLWFGADVDALTDSGQGVRVRAGGAWHSARYLIAADGAHSAVRTMVGARLQRTGYPTRALRILTSTPLDQFLPGLAPLTYVRDPVQSCSVLALPDHWRIIIRVPDTGAADQRLPPARVRALARRALPLAGNHQLTITQAHCYGLARGVLDSFRHGHVLFVGDAAHVLSTAGGMGLNAGLHDAVDLGRVLAAVLGGASTCALQAWAQRRRQILLQRLIPRSEARVAGVQDGNPAHLAAGLAHIQEVAADPDATRAWLAEASMLDAAPASAAPSHARSA